LLVSVNENELETLEIDPAKDSGRTILIPNEMLKSDQANRIKFKLDGRATFSYSALMTGFVPADKIASTTNDWLVTRNYQPAKLIVDGQTINRGWNVVNGNYSSFTNPLTQLPVGDLGEVTLMPRRLRMTSDRDEKFDYLVLTEPIPAGCIVLDGSVSGAYERFEIEPGQITFYIGDTRNVGDIRYSLLGYVPGKYRVPQSVLRSFYAPSSFAVSTSTSLEVLAADGKSADEYKLSPNELFALGELEFAKGNFGAAHQHLTKLFTEFQLQAKPYEQVIRLLFASSLALGHHGDTVAYFEILKEKFPEVEISFEDILRVANSYRELGEYERGYLVYRSTVEGSFERESQVAGFLNPLELAVEEDVTSGRVRVTVKDAGGGTFARDVQVNVIGSSNDDFVSGKTDLRGLMIADDIRGTSTVIAMRDANRYAFYRGKHALQHIKPQSSVADPFGAVSGNDLFRNDQVRVQAQAATPAKPGQADLRGNLFNQNGIFQMEQKSNFDGLLNNDRSGVKSKEAY
jgi:hypothetical protein